MCYDNTNHKVAKGEGCIGKAVRGGKKSITKPNTKTRIRAMTEEHGREGIEVHNS